MPGGGARTLTRAAAVALAVVAFASCALTVPASARRDLFPLGVDEIRLSVTLEEAAAETHRLNETRLLAALGEKAVWIADRYKSNRKIKTEDASAFFQRNPAMNSRPKVLHAHFDIGLDPADPSVLVVAARSRRGAYVRRSGPFAPVTRVEARCDGPDCVYSRIVGSVAQFLTAVAAPAPLEPNE